MANKKTIIATYGSILSMSLQEKHQWPRALSCQIRPETKNNIVWISLLPLWFFPTCQWITMTVIQIQIIRSIFMGMIIFLKSIWPTGRWWQWRIVHLSGIVSSSYRLNAFAFSLSLSFAVVVQRKRNQTSREGNSLHSTERRPLLGCVLTSCSTIDNEHCPFSSLALSFLCLSPSCSLSFSTGHRAFTTLSPLLAFIHSFIHSLRRSRRHLVQQVCTEASEPFQSTSTHSRFAFCRKTCLVLPNPKKIPTLRNVLSRRFSSSLKTNGRKSRRTIRRYPWLTLPKWSVNAGGRWALTRNLITKKTLDKKKNVTIAKSLNTKVLANETDERSFFSFIQCTEFGKRKKRNHVVFVCKWCVHSFIHSLIKEKNDCVYRRVLPDVLRLQWQCINESYCLKAMTSNALLKKRFTPRNKTK